MFCRFILSAIKNLFLRGLENRTVRNTSFRLFARFSLYSICTTFTTHVCMCMYVQGRI